MTRLAYVAVVAAVAFLLGLSGCGSVSVVPEDPAPAGADGAAALVWGAYGGAPAARPAVAWTSVRDCAAGAPGWIVAGACAVGETTAPDFSLVGRWDGAALAYTALAHELCHAWSWQTTGDPDARHLGPCFAKGGMVDQANVALARAEGASEPTFAGSPP